MSIRRYMRVAVRLREGLASGSRIGATAHRPTESHHASITRNGPSLVAGDEHGFTSCSDSTAIAVWWWRRVVLGNGSGLGNGSDRLDHCGACGRLPAIWVSRKKGPSNLVTSSRILAVDATAAKSSGVIEAPYGLEDSVGNACRLTVAGLCGCVGLRCEDSFRERIRNSPSTESNPQSSRRGSHHSLDDDQIAMMLGSRRSYSLLTTA
jgi:hypothetical protein